MSYNIDAPYLTSVMQGSDAAYVLNSYSVECNASTSSSSPIITALSTTDESLSTNDSAGVSTYSAAEEVAYADISTFAATGANSVVLGDTATASGAGSIAVGGNSSGGATASGIDSIAMGGVAKAQKDRAIAIGAGSGASGDSAVAIGYKTQATGDYATALGGSGAVSGATAITASGSGAIAIGTNGATGAKATGVAAIAIGGASSATNNTAIAIGSRASSQGISSIAMGSGSVASQNSAIALGGSAQATSLGGLSVGTGATSSGLYAASFGMAAKASADSGVAIGYSSEATIAAGVYGYDPGTKKASTSTNIAWKSTLGAVSVGNSTNTRQITGVAAGYNDTDAVNVAQLKSVTSGFTLTAGGANSSTVASGSSIDLSAGSSNLTVSKNASDNKVVFDLAQNISITSVTAGTNVLNATGLKIGTTGPSITTSGLDAGNLKVTKVAAGILDATSTDAVNGSQLYATNQNVTTIQGDISNIQGDITNIQGDVTTIQGDISNITSNITNGTLGPVQRTATDNVLALVDKDGDATNPGATQKLTNLTAGELSASSTDAVNGSQLYATNQNVTTIQGDVTTIQGDISNITTNITNGTLGPVQRVNGEDVLTLVAQDGSSSAPGATQKLTNLTAGELSETSTDAVNGSQLYATNQNVTTIQGDISNIQGDITNIQGDVTTIQGDISNIQGDVTTIQGDISNITTNITNGTLGPVQRVNGEDVLTLVAQDGSSSAPGATQKLTNLTAGELSETSTDAVNGSQLYATNQNVTTIQGDISNITTNITNGTLGPVQRVNGEDVLTLVAQDGSSSAPGATQKLTNLTAGELSETSTDAVNGSQLYATNTAIGNFLGAGAGYINGSWVGPNFSYQTVGTDGIVKNATATNVGDALSDLGTGVANVNDRVNNIDNSIGDLADSALQWDDINNAFSATHKDANGDIVNSKITDVADGIIAQGSTDAINGSQLYTSNAAVADYLGAGAGYVNGSWVAPSFSYQTVGTDGIVKNATATNVGDALSDLGTGVANVNNRINTIDETIGSLTDGALQWDDSKNAYSAARKDDNGNVVDSKITDVANGTIAKGSTDAVNGGQLWETNQKIDNIQGDITNVANNAVMYSTDADGNKTNKIELMGDDAGTPVTITNVADGEVKSGSKDAVNGGQLYDYTKEQMGIVYDQAKEYTDYKVNNMSTEILNQANAYTDLRYDSLNREIQETKKEARQAAAIGLAAANLRYDDTPGKLSVSVGGGAWRGQGAGAFGAGYTSESGKFRSNFSAVTTGSNWGVGAGLSWTLN